MSTDTAFALGMLALVGPRFPDRLRAFMLTVVVVDDIAALVVIATLLRRLSELLPLLLAVVLFGGVVVSCKAGLHIGLVLFALGAAAWVAC